MSSIEQAPPPGFYVNPDGAGLRYWDGARWTEHVQPESARAPRGEWAALIRKRSQWRKLSWALIAWNALVVAFVIVQLAQAPGKCAATGSDCGAGPWVGAALFLVQPALLLAWALTRPKEERQPGKSATTSGEGSNEAVQSGSNSPPRPPGSKLG